jgi:hypothetical protein
LYREAFFALILEDPQISCQNLLTNSQLLFSLKRPTKVLINTFSVSLESFKRNKELFFDMLAMTSLTNDEVVKYELSVNVENMDCYVAPAVVDTEQVTFWAPSSQASHSNIKEETQPDGNLKKIL